MPLWSTVMPVIHYFSDAQIVWFQEYISKKEAEARFPESLRPLLLCSVRLRDLGRFTFFLRITISGEMTLWFYLMSITRLEEKETPLFQ